MVQDNRLPSNVQHCTSLSVDLDEAVTRASVSGVRKICKIHTGMPKVQCGNMTCQTNLNMWMCPQNYIKKMNHVLSIQVLSSIY